MAKFEYLCLIIDSEKPNVYEVGTSSKDYVNDNRPLLDIMNDLGDKGWELITTVDDYNSKITLVFTNEKKIC